MKKSIICCLLALLLLVSLAGCRDKPDATAPSTEATASGPAQAQEEVRLPILPLDDSQMADPAARVIDRAPLEGREGLKIPGSLPSEDFFLSYSAVPTGLTIYPNASPNNSRRSIYFSFKPWDLRSFAMDENPFRSTLRVEAREWTPEAAPQLDPAAQPDALPYFIYASWRGMDWKELARLELAAREDPGDADAARARDAFRAQYLEDFLALQPQDLPALPYLYEIRLSFPPDAEGGQAADESIPIIYYAASQESPGDVSIGDPGIIVSAEDPRPAETPGLTLLQPGYEALAAPLNDGDCRAKAMEFTAGEDLILHGLKLYKSNIRIEKIAVLRRRDCGGVLGRGRGSVGTGRGNCGDPPDPPRPGGGELGEGHPSGRR